MDINSRGNSQQIASRGRPGYTLIDLLATIPVCPHAGGVGLCEYVQHLSMFDYICVSGTFEDRIAEYADHLHEHFVAPLVMQDGHYMPPTVPGYSITMKPESLAMYEFPSGAAWQS